MSGHGAVERPVQIGVVGAGSVATSFHLPILSNLETAEIAFVADLDRQLALEYGNIYDATPVPSSEPGKLPACDAALLATPVGVREEYIREFGRQNVALFSEKPFAPSYEKHHSFLSDLTFAMTNYMRMTYSSIDQLGTLLETQMLGNLERASLSRSMTGATGISTDTYATDSDMSGGGILIERGCHDLSQLCCLFDGDALSVDHASVVWNGDFDVGVSVELEASIDDNDVPIDYQFSMVEPMDNGSVYEFEDATVTFDHVDAESRLSVTPKSDADVALNEFVLVPTEESAQNTREAMYLRWKSFLDALTTGSVLNLETQTGLHVTRLMSEIYQAPDEEREVD